MKPDSDRKAGIWAKGVKVIERFRFEHGITDPLRAFGDKDEPWEISRHLDAVHQQLEPPVRSRGMRM